MAEHYGCLVDPARAVKPKDKPRVERAMPYVRDSFWRGRSFASLADMQARASTWCTEVAGTRSHRGLDGASPLSVFRAVEAPALLALPDRAFQLARWMSPKVAPDCHVMVDKVLYSVPWVHIGKVTDTRVTDTAVMVHIDGTLIKTWPKVQRGRCTDFADYPSEKIAFFSRNPIWCRTQVAGLGPHVAELIGGLLAVQALHRLRSAQGILRLAEAHGAQRLDEACACALVAGDPTYRTVHGILAAGTETATVGSGDGGASGTVAAARGAPAHLHGLDGLLGHLPAPPSTRPADDAGDDVTAVGPVTGRSGQPAQATPAGAVAVAAPGGGRTAVVEADRDGRHARTAARPGPHREPRARRAPRAADR